MPYIRREFRDAIRTGAITVPEDAGQLNYMITRLVNQYISREGASYATFNTVVGVLECAKMELYRRPIAEYEDGKIKENGDVYAP